jgi:hypothetical protein
MIHSQSNARTLASVRTVVFAIWFFTIVIAPFQELLELPGEVFQPVGPLKLIPSGVLNILLTANAVALFKWLLAGLLLCSLGARPYRLIAIPTVMLLTIEQALVRGFGHVNHGSVPLLLAAWILALIRPERKLEGDPTKTCPDSALALQAMTLLLLLTYVFTGVFRLANSTPEIFTSGTMGHYLCYLAASTPYWGMRYEHFLLESPTMLFLLNAGFLFVTIIEALSLFCLCSRQFRWFWLIVMISFHFLTWVFMNIFFWQNLVLFPLLLCDLCKMPWLRPSVASSGIDAAVVLPNSKGLCSAA